MPFAIESHPRSVGEHVRVRASCPIGVTEWYSLGQMPVHYDHRESDVLRISSVSPQSIPRSRAMDDQESAVGNRLGIYGPKLTADCRIEAQVNGTAIELNNVLFKKNHFEGLLMNRDINYRRITPRFAELKLSIRRQSGKRIYTMKYVPFG